MGNRCWTLDSETLTLNLTSWLVLSKLLVSPQVAKPLENNWQPKLQGSLLQLPEVSRSHIGIAQELWHSVKSVDIKNLPSCRSASCHSNVSFERLPRISKPTCVSNLAQLWLSRKLQRHIWLAFSKILTCALSTLSESPSCLRTFN